MYPILDFDEDKSAILNPHKIIIPTEDVPENFVICFFQDEIDKLRESGRIRELTHLKSEMGKHPVYVFTDTEKIVGLFNPGIGGSLAAACFEEVIALGGNKFIACGGAGALESAYALGNIIVSSEAIRDEGTSYHYLPAGEKAFPTKRVFSEIVNYCTENKIPFTETKTWTTDGLYRETKGKVQKRVEQGCGVVEMEAASLFAVAQFRNVEIGQILYAGDDLSGDQWDSRDWKKATSVRERVLQIATDICMIL